jgi:hypothetical protein
MRSTLLAAALVAVSTTAIAASPPLLGGTFNTNTAIAAQQQGQIQGQSTRVRQSNRQANTQTSIHEDKRNSGIAPSIGLGGFASGPCVGVTTQGGFGVGLPGGAAFGGSAGRSELDDECTRRETARILHSMGQSDLALKVMMSSPTVQAVMPKPVATAPAPVTQASSTTSGEKHPACSPSSWATAETRKALGC